jgi:hypothetical protein
MLIVGIIMIFVANIIGGWQFMCDTMSPGDRPRLARTPEVLLVAVVLALVGIVLLFIVKWYGGLVGIAGVIIGFNVFAVIWHVIYQRLRL